MESVLSIAGSDCSGCSGIQADIKTITAHQLFAQSVVTVLAAENTQGLQGVLEVSPEFVAQQIDTVFEDIRPDAVKVGILSNPEMIDVVAERLVAHKARHIVVDPTLRTPEGETLVDKQVMDLLKEKIFPLADLVVLNIPEAETLFGLAISGDQDMVEAAHMLKEHCPQGSILITGGHLATCSDDFLATADGYEFWLRHRRIQEENTKGAGTTLSAAAACYLAVGMDMQPAVQNAKNFVSGALRAGLDLGQGNGPLNHMWNL